MAMHPTLVSTCGKSSCSEDSQASHLYGIAACAREMWKLWKPLKTNLKARLAVVHGNLPNGCGLFGQFLEVLKI
jgi:hypothetical protein